MELGGVASIVHPEVEDASGDDGALCRIEEAFDNTEYVAPDIGYPQGGVPELFEFRRSFRGFPGVPIAKSGAPDSSSGDLQHDGGTLSARGQILNG
jgi:hypothetical protein